MRRWTGGAGRPGPGRCALARLAALALAGLVAACGQSDPLDAFQPGEAGRVVRIVDGDSLVLDTGQSVRLVAIEAPAPARGERPGEPHAARSARMLEDMALGRRVRLYYAGLTRDRYDRALAHAVTEDALGPRYWLNREMVVRGGARVRVYPDTATGADALLALEAEARAAGRGLWGEREFAVLRAGDVAPWQTGFVLVDGVLGARQGSDRPEAVCERPLLGSAVRLEIRASAWAVCDWETGPRVLARGYIRDRRIDITHVHNVTEVARERAP